jgi:hypothetical protein
MIVEDISHAARYRHMGSGRTGASQANYTATGGFIHRTGTPVTVSPARPEPTHPSQPRHASSGRGNAPLDLPAGPQRSREVQRGRARVVSRRKGPKAPQSVLCRPWSAWVSAAPSTSSPCRS